MAGPPVRERYNAKARGSTAGGSAHKKRKRPSNKEVAAGQLAEAQVSAADELANKSLESEGGEGRGGMSAKKRKRMDSYIVRPALEPNSSLFLGQKAQDGIPSGDAQAAPITRAVQQLVGESLIVVLARAEPVESNERQGAGREAGGQACAEGDRAAGKEEWGRER